MEHDNIDLDADSAFRGIRRRTALVFRLNIGLSFTITTVLMSAIATGVVFGFLGRDAHATALGGVALLDLIGAAIYWPLRQINRALVRSIRIEMLILNARDRLRHLTAVNGDDGKTIKSTWESILREFRALEKD